MWFGLDGVTITVDDVYLVTSKIVLDRCSSTCEGSMAVSLDYWFAY